MGDPGSIHQEYIQLLASRYTKILSYGFSKARLTQDGESSLEPPPQQVMYSMRFEPWSLELRPNKLADEPHITVLNAAIFSLSPSLRKQRRSPSTNGIQTAQKSLASKITRYTRRRVAHGAGRVDQDERTKSIPRLPSDALAEKESAVLVP